MRPSLFWTVDSSCSSSGPQRVQSIIDSGDVTVRSQQCLLILLMGIVVNRITWPNIEKCLDRILKMCHYPIKTEEYNDLTLYLGLFLTCIELSCDLKKSYVKNQNDDHLLAYDKN